MRATLEFQGCMKSQILLAGGAAILLASCAHVSQKRKPEPVASLDLPRYMGAWRVIACTDNKVERDFVDAEETYALRSDGKIDVHFTWRDKSFDAPVKTHDFKGRVVGDGTNAQWKMRLFPLFAASYVIVEVSPDYSCVAIAHPSRKFGWILARKRDLPPEQLQEMLTALKQQGYDLKKFILVPQDRMQRLGAPAVNAAG